jgi:hypothetical protein
MSIKDKPWSYVQSQEGFAARLPCGRRGEGTCCAKRPKRKKTARSDAALRRAAYYPLSLPPHCTSSYRFFALWLGLEIFSA